MCICMRYTIGFSCTYTTTLKGFSFSDTPIHSPIHPFYISNIISLFMKLRFWTWSELKIAPTWLSVYILGICGRAGILNASVLSLLLLCTIQYCVRYNVYNSIILSCCYKWGPESHNWNRAIVGSLDILQPSAVDRVDLWSRPCF